MFLTWKGILNYHANISCDIQYGITLSIMLRDYDETLVIKQLIQGSKFIHVIEHRHVILLQFKQTMKSVLY